MSNIELPPLPTPDYSTPVGDQVVLTWKARSVQQYARAAVELNQKPASIDVGAMCRALDSIKPYACRGDEKVIEQAIVMLRSLDAERQEGESVLLQSGPITCRNGKLHDRINDCLYCRIAALEANEAIYLRQRDEARKLLGQLVNRMPGTTAYNESKRMAEQIVLDHHMSGTNSEGYANND